jgi:hypothetical protein
VSSFYGFPLESAQDCSKKGSNRGGAARHTSTGCHTLYKLVHMLCRVSPCDFVEVVQQVLRNTSVLVVILYTRGGAAGIRLLVAACYL